jgi:hypothetical protein
LRVKSSSSTRSAAFIADLAAAKATMAKVSKVDNVRSRWPVVVADNGWSSGG